MKGGAELGMSLMRECITERHELSRALIVDDDPGQRSLLESAVSNAGVEVASAEGGRAALEMLDQGPWDLVISDVKMPDMDGFELLKAIRQKGVEVPILFVTGYADIKDAVSAMQMGAIRYLEKPIDLHELKEVLDEVLEGEDSEEQALPLLEGTVVEAPAMKNLFEEVALIAPSAARVLITGESGVGKEVLAEHLHAWSDRSAGPLIRINCAAIPENLLESELFGHEKGAFTGAERKHEGCFLRANGGTLFLDEIGEMALSLQAKMLRVLQDGVVTPLGSSHSVKVDVRVISATNQELEKRIEEKSFREDLFYRLNVVELFCPPLRDRSEEVVHLAKTMAVAFAKETRRFSPGFEKELLAYSWPGNVRELRNAMERAVLLSRGGILLPEHLPDRILKASPSEGKAKLSASEGSGAKALADRELDWILKALEEHGGQRTAAAKALGISRRNLLYKIKKMESLGMKIPPPGGRS
jgi:DNA-binding NtrC family response regulator